MGPGRRHARRRSITGAAACGALLVAACGGASGGAPVSATSTRGPTASASLAPSATTSSNGQDRAALARRYVAIAVAGNHHLEHDFDGLASDHRNLAAARAYLRDAAATERLFDRRLLQMALPPPLEIVARLLVAANEDRARLTEQATGSTSLAQLRAYERRLTAANAPVEDAVRVIRSMLQLPPPKTS